MALLSPQLRPGNDAFHRTLCHEQRCKLHNLIFLNIYSGHRLWIIIIMGILFNLKAVPNTRAKVSVMLCPGSCSFPESHWMSGSSQEAGVPAYSHPSLEHCHLFPESQKNLLLFGEEENQR